MDILNKIKNVIVKYRTYILIVIILLLSVVSIVFQNIKDKSRIYINGNEMQENKYEDKIAVYIAGEVKNPGVYYINENTRLNDLIGECGGLTSEADLSEINLAEKLNDSDKIVIPKISNELENGIVKDLEDQSSGKININTATKDDLKTLNGVGDTLANNIIEYRKQNRFNSIEDILNVNGIGESKYNAIKEYICVN